MLTTILTAVLLSSTPAATELVLARFTNVGLDDAYLKKARARLVSELAEADAKLVKPVTEVDDACIQTPACLQGAIGPHRGALVVDILRIGPMVTITAELYGADGNRLATVEQATDTTAFDEGGVFLGTDLLDPIRDLAPPLEVAPMAADTAMTENTTSESASSSSAAASEPFPILPTIFLAGGGVVIATALVVGIVSIVGMVSQAQVLQTPTTTTGEKDMAISLGRMAMLGFGLGVVGAAVGGGVAAAGLFVE